MFNYDVQLPPIGRGNVPKGNYQLKQYCQPSECLTLNNRDSIIEIRATDRVIHDVRKILISYLFLIEFMLVTFSLKGGEIVKMT